MNSTAAAKKYAVVFTGNGRETIYAPDNLMSEHATFGGALNAAEWHWKNNGPTYAIFRRTDEGLTPAYADAE